MDAPLRRRGSTSAPGGDDEDVMIVAREAPEPPRLHEVEELVAALDIFSRDYAATCREVRAIDPAEVRWALFTRRRLYHRLLHATCRTAAALVNDGQVATW